MVHLVLEHSGVETLQFTVHPAAVLSLVGDPHRAPPLDGGGQPGRAGVAALHPNWAGQVSQPWCANPLAMTIFLLAEPVTAESTGLYWGLMMG